MKSCLIFLLAAYYTDLRKATPVAKTRAINTGIKAFADSDPAVAEAVKEAKLIADAERVRNRRKSVVTTFQRGRMKGGSIVHVPCHRKK